MKVAALMLQLKNLILLKEDFLFLTIQEYYRNFENFNLLLKKYISDKTPKNILIILKINLVLIFFQETQTCNSS